MNDEVPEGYRREWARDDDWKIADLERKCRMKGCQHQAVAALRRAHRSRYLNQPLGFHWWYYCADHLYGRKIEDGVVKSNRLVEAVGESLPGRVENEDFMPDKLKSSDSAALASPQPVVCEKCGKPSRECWCFAADDVFEDKKACRCDVPNAGLPLVGDGRCQVCGKEA